MGIPKIEENKYYSYEEYLAFEELAEEKHEYHSGKIIAMAGGTANHSLISGNTHTELNMALRKSKKSCMAFNSDMKVNIKKFDRNLYPDASVVCGKPKTNINQTVLANPMLIIEVLSKSTKDYDKGEKFEFYRSLPSFKEYVIIYQTVPKVQTWYKEAENLWRIGNAFGLDASIYLHSIDATIELKYIYDNVQNLNLDDEAKLVSSY